VDISAESSNSELYINSNSERLNFEDNNLPSPPEMSIINQENKSTVKAKVVHDFT
jgi:hypothetical protein